MGTKDHLAEIMEIVLNALTVEIGEIGEETGLKDEAGEEIMVVARRSASNATKLVRSIYSIQSP